jgi:hypothetical protein
VHQRVRGDLVDPRSAACFEVAEEDRRLGERDVEDQVGVDAGEAAHRRAQGTVVVLDGVEPAEAGEHALVERLDA